jgi:hypothetical protein
VIEIRDVEGLLQTKEIIDVFLDRDQPEGPSDENR